MTLPLQLLFHVDSASLKSGRYRETVKHYHAALMGSTPPTSQNLFGETPWADLPRPLAFIRLTDEEKPLLSDCVDYLLDHDVQPIAQDGTQVKERGWDDVRWILENPAIHRAPFLLHVAGDYRVTVAAGTTLHQVLTAAVSTLASNKDVLTVGFPGTLNLFPGQQVSQHFSICPMLKWPAVVRSRDLYLASVLAGATGGQPVDQVLSAFSQSPVRHLAFNQSIATVQ